MYPFGGGRGGGWKAKRTSPPPAREAGHPRQRWTRWMRFRAFYQSVFLPPPAVDSIVITRQAAGGHKYRLYL